MRYQRLIPVLAVPVLALSGCGVAGTQFHPGLAAQVGDEQITTRHLDSLTDGYCQAIEAVSGDEGTQQIPLRYLTHEFATTLVIEAATRQIAEEYDVTAGPAYEQTLTALEPQVAELSEAQREAVLEIEGAQAYYQDVLTTVGGVELDDAGASDEEKVAAGQEVLDDWMARNDVEVNPKYGFEYGTPTQVDTDTSFAVSTQAKGGLLDQPSDEYASSLPDRLVCGS